MARYSTAFGMDVHLRSTTVCALVADTGESETRRFGSDEWEKMAEWMGRFPQPSKAAYESGYCGFAPYRALTALGIDVDVAAVSRLPRTPKDSRAKNDRSDARRIAGAILSHDVTPVWVPSPEVERLRDVSRALEDLGDDLAAAKQRLLALLARRGLVYGGRTASGRPRKYWTWDFWRWLDSVAEERGGQAPFSLYRDEVEWLQERRDRATALAKEEAEASSLAPAVRALQCMKGCGFMLALAFAAEVGDFSRFSGGRRVTSYFGLAPGERASGEKRVALPASGAGNALVRKLAIEGSWTYLAAKPGPKVAPRSARVPLAIRQHARDGSERLRRRRARFAAAEMPAAKANAATAAELVRWLWALGLMAQESPEG